MDFMKLFAAVLAFFFQPGSNTGKANGQMICRRGTERPCYKVSNVPDAKRRLTFEDARQTCRSDGGELLSIETEGEQRLVERFIQQLQAGDRDFWIVLRQSPPRHGQGATVPGCPSRFYWLEGSKAKFRNWHWGEPSCHGEMCVVLYDQQSASPDGDVGHFLFQWSGNSCNSKNNVVCKYPEEKAPVFTHERNVTRAAPVPSLKPKLSSTTKSDDKTKIAPPESSVSLSENALHVHYILYATVPTLLLLLFAAVGFFCYRKHTKRRKTQTNSHPSRSQPWKPTTAPLCPVQGPYAFSDVTKLPHAALAGGVPADIMTKYFGAPSPDPPCDDYENVPCAYKESGFVTNDIYETCRAQSRRCRGQTGWVENEIYG